MLVEGDSKRSKKDFCGRNSGNDVVIFPKVEGIKPGNYVHVRIKEATSATLIGEIES